MNKPSVPGKNEIELLKDAGELVYQGLFSLYPPAAGWKSEQRAKCLLEVMKRTNKILIDAGLTKEQIRQCSLKLGVPLLEYASLEEEPTLQQLWATLLANALNPEFKEEILPIFITIAKDLSPFDALMFKTYCERGNTINDLTKVIEDFLASTTIAVDNNQAKLLISIATLIKSGLIDDTQLVDNSINKIVDNLSNIPLIPNDMASSAFQLNKVRKIRRLSRQKVITKSDMIQITPLGWAFFSTCIKKPNS